MPDAVSPCTSVCSINAIDGYCKGCYRTLEEIASWGSMSQKDKHHVLRLLPAREIAKKAPRTHDT